MAVNRVPVLKRCRSLGMDPVYLGIDKKSTRQLKRANRKMSEYGMQLNEKQKVKFIYGVLEKQFRKYYTMATKRHGITGEMLLQILETRLDNVVFRLGFAGTRREARQMVNHSHITINGKKVNIPSYLVKAGDVITVREIKKDNSTIKANVEANSVRPVPAWLEKDNEKFKENSKHHSCCGIHHDCCIRLRKNNRQG